MLSATTTAGMESAPLRSLPVSGRVGRSPGRDDSNADHVEDEAFWRGGTHAVRFAALDQDLAGSVDRQQPLTFR
jgi:hypothetical protein